ncbi:chromosomal replication initiator DnaA [Salipiger sp. IMCC34102]|uniref:DnaA/Hda family protein n=1 Tax=Salipiger sp. IMCC34102 TaxID=2510647 RepID=UPI00101DEE70|nr:DnaA/Hda family protein [Salipiger sp. IMCC34102]RYH01821.1 chromosomal replication initiator DnaA [Salipiger sp. IMCC34102]
MARQLTFDWPVGVSLEASDFFVSEANQAAFRMVGDPARWPQGKLLLTGPEGSGKSHLARVFAGARRAPIVGLSGLGARPSETALVVEDVDRMTPAQEEPLFHLHNHMIALGLPLLMTARTRPVTWGMRLPDLASRMQATVPVQIAPPDDALLEAVLMKLFADRQVRPPAALPRYLATRIDRSYSAAQGIVEALDRRALLTGKSVSLRMAADILQEDSFDDR